MLPENVPHEFVFLQLVQSLAQRCWQYVDFFISKDFIIKAVYIFLNRLGRRQIILKRDERFIAAQVIYTGASNPETSLLYEFTVGQRIALAAFICLI